MYLKWNANKLSFMEVPHIADCNYKSIVAPELREARFELSRTAQDSSEEH